MFPRISPIANSPSPATQSDILGILQREQDRAVALLSTSPLLTSLFVSYANQAAALESVTPSTESEDWKALEDMISSLREEIDKLRPENFEIKERLEAATASQETFRSQVLGLNEVNTAQQDEIKSLRAELLEAGGKLNQLLTNSNAERTTLQAQILNLEGERAKLKEAIVKYQIKVRRLEHKDSGGSPKTTSSDDCKLEGLEDNISTNVSARSTMSRTGADFPLQSSPVTGLSPPIHLQRTEPPSSIPPTSQKPEVKDRNSEIPKLQPARPPKPPLRGPPAPVTPESRNSSLCEDTGVIPVIVVPGTSLPRASETEKGQPSASDKGKGKTRAVDFEEPQKPAPESDSANDTFADILRHVMELSKSTPTPRSSDEAGPSGTPPSSSGLAGLTVSWNEQVQINLAVALSSVEHIQDTLAKLQKDFVLPTELDHYPPSADDRDETASVASAPSSDLTKLIPYTRANKPVYEYESELHSLLEEVDMIDSHGDDGLREKKKEIAQTVGKALEGIEDVIGEAVGKRLSLIPM